MFQNSEDVGIHFTQTAEHYLCLHWTDYYLIANFGDFLYLSIQKFSILLKLLF